jgi:multidrug resistance efflux pump
MPAQKAPLSAPAPPTELILPGRLQASNSLQLGPAVEGKIEAFHVEVGAEVYEGQLLAQVRSEAAEGSREAALLDQERSQSRVQELESAISSARLEASRAAADASRVNAEFDRAEKQLERQKLLFSQGATPRNDFEKAQREFSAIERERNGLGNVAGQAEERVANLTRELDLLRRHLDAKTEELEQVQARIAAGDIYAPVSGVVTARRGELGESITPNWKDLFTIAVDLTKMQAIVETTSANLTGVRIGSPALISVAESAVPLSGEVTSIANGIVVIEFANPSPLIRPGMTAQVRIKLT